MSLKSTSLSPVSSNNPSSTSSDIESSNHMPSKIQNKVLSITCTDNERQSTNNLKSADKGITHNEQNQTGIDDNGMNDNSLEDYDLENCRLEDGDLENTDIDEIEDFDDIEDDDFDTQDDNNPSSVTNGLASDSKGQSGSVKESGFIKDSYIKCGASPASNTAKAHEIEINTQHTVEDNEAGQRIDKLAASILSEQSRAQIQEWLKAEQLTVNGEVVKAKYRVKPGDSIQLQAVLKQHSDDEPENIPLNIVYEDDSVAVINKPVGMVVHPGAGNWTGTLVNALLYHYPDQAHLPRAGLVHRIDKDTSGLLVIGKTKAAQMALQAQLKDKSVYRHYRCVVAGDAASLTRQRVINAPIGRHRVQRTKMTVTSVGKEAVTHLIDITPLSQSYCLVDVKLETGRTHQIRVHLSHIGHPLIGDSIYGKRQQLRAGISEAQRQAVQNFPRQALHAYKLGFIHPETQKPIEVTAPMPKDILELVAILTD